MRASITLLYLLLSAAALQAQRVRITLPLDGAVVHPGDTLTVRVSGPGTGSTGIRLVSDLDLEVRGQLALQLPYRFSIYIPRATQPGPHVITASRRTASDNSEDSASITVDVEPSQPFLRLRAEFTSLELDVGRETALQIIGEYADGSELNLTKSTQTTFVPEVLGIVSVSKDGLVRALRPGSTSIVVNGVLKIPVTVSPLVDIDPEKVTMLASESRKFVARIASRPSPAVSWSLSPEAAGRISADGLYTAPDSVAIQQTVVLTAHTVSGDATTTITLSPKTSVRISPEWVTLYPGEPVQFKAETANLGTGGVIWSVTPASKGSMNAAGLYTAPKAIAALEKVTVAATSVTNPSVDQSTIIWLSPQPFCVNAWDNALTVVAGHSVTAKILELATDRFSHPVAFAVAGLPPGVTATFSPKQLTGTGQTLLTVNAGADAVPGTYRFAVTGTDTIYAALTSSQTVTVKIQSAH